MELMRALDTWNGKSSDDILEIYQLHQEKEPFLESVISLIAKSEYQLGATWLLKAYLERGNQLNKNQNATIFSLLTQLKHWGSKLHLLQSLVYMKIEKPYYYAIKVTIANI